MVWYFPLWYMGLSGYEVTIMSSISPILLESSALRRMFSGNLPTLQATTIFGLLAYSVQSEHVRLFAVSLGVWQACLAWTTSFASARGNPAKLEARICAWTIGLIASSIVKFANQSNNPLWPVFRADNGGWNKTGILLFALAVARSYQSHNGRTEATGSQEKPKGSSIPAGLGIAGLVFALHSLLSDSSTMILWVWEGYPVRGPIAVPHGAWTIFVMGAGLLFGLFYPNITRTWSAFGVGSLGAAVLTYFHHWFGYYGALTLTFYLTALTPVLLSNAVRFSPGRTSLLASSCTISWSSSIAGLSHTLSFPVDLWCANVLTGS